MTTFAGYYGSCDIYPVPVDSKAYVTAVSDDERRRSAGRGLSLGTGKGQLKPSKRVRVQEHEY
jgi:hypothetical protein